MFYRSDPITRLFRARLKLQPWSATLIIWLIVNLPIFVACVINQTLFTKGSRVGLFEDFGWWTYQVSTFPTTIFGLLWLPDGIMSVLDRLRRNRVIVIPTPEAETKWENSLHRFAHSFSRWLWTLIVPIPIALFMVTLFIPQQATYNTWQTQSPFTFWYTVGVWFFVLMAGALLIVKGAVAIAWFNRLFREFPIIVKVLHPDGAGGLSPLGNFSVGTGYILSVYGLGLVIGHLSEASLLNKSYSEIVTQPYVLIFWAIYFIVAPSLFFLPLGVAHSAMAQAKEEYIAKLSNQFDVEMSEIQSVLNRDAIGLKDRLEKIEMLQKLYHFATNFPVWPFNTTSLVRFFSSVVSPFILSLLSVLVEKLLFP